DRTRRRVRAPASHAVPRTGRGMKEDRAPVYWLENAPVTLAARALSTVYGGLAGLRRTLYRKGWLRAQRASVPVFVVGNIAGGGTCKTRVTIALAHGLRAAGL